jgi:hypothetical protein
MILTNMGKPFSPIFFLFFFFQFPFLALMASDEAFSLRNLRSIYPRASADEALSQKFYQQMATYRGNDPVVLGYKAVSEAIQAKYVWSPYNKLRHVRNAKKIFQLALSKHPYHPEVRFLRYTMEYSIPKYLKMSEHLEEDRRLIVENLLRYPASDIDREGFNLMRDFMIAGDHLASFEKEKLKNK